MIPKDCKRLAEVDFPIAEVSRHAAREKSIRHGHPSTLHLWWARRPLASSRAMLLALLWPDPCDPLCPDEFKIAARELLRSIPNCNPGRTDEELRGALLTFIADFANWELSANHSYLEVSRALVKVLYGNEAPLVVDSFAGGGSIPLEALRVGCDSFANDLNPISTLLCRFLLVDVPRYGEALHTAIQNTFHDLIEHLSDRIGDLYSTGAEEEPATAFLWARSVFCEEPQCGASIPLLRTLWLSRSSKGRWALRIVINRRAGRVPHVGLEVYSPSGTERVQHGTVLGGKAVCPACSKSLSRERVEEQLRVQRGGTSSARLVAVIVANDQGRYFRNPTKQDFDVIDRAKVRATELQQEKFCDGTSVLPTELINPHRPSPNARGLSAVTRYGMRTFSHCYLPRQKIALSEIVKFVRQFDVSSPTLDGAVGRFLLILLGRCVDRWSSLCRLDSTRDTVTGSFSKQALQMVWDFCEANPFSNWSGGLANAANWIIRAVEHAMNVLPHPASVNLGDACALPLPDHCAHLWFTDPPYYDSVPYADLSDFFFCWVRRANPVIVGDCALLDDIVLTPKAQECVWNQAHKGDDGHPKDQKFFERCVERAFSEGNRILQPDGIGCIVFAHKSTEGWEALLAGIIRAGLAIVASWPVQTEMKARTSARDAASLMGSVNLVCRPRPKDAPVGDWADVLRELPKRVSDWIERLQSEGVRGADLVFACMGPALEIFSRYAKVETAEGREIQLDEYLEKVWEVVGRSALGQVLGTAEARARNGGAGALEEDARLTALFLWTLQSTNGEPADNGNGISNDENPMDDEQEEGSSRKVRGFTLMFDVVRRFAQPLGIELPKWEGRIIETKKGVVRLLPVMERAKQLFGQEEEYAVAARLEQASSAGDNPLQGVLFPDLEPVSKVRRVGRERRHRILDSTADENLIAVPEATTLDRVHTAMLLQASGRTNALRALLKAEQECGSNFMRLANALTALYPTGSEEKRLLEAMLVAVPR